VENPEFVGAVKLAKRSPDYRRLRATLSSVSPADVWREEQTTRIFISFEAASVDPRSFQSFLMFVVDLSNATVHEPHVLSMTVGEDGWRVTNTGIVAVS
jgi:hypothetical protein